MGHKHKVKPTNDTKDLQEVLAREELHHITVLCSNMEKKKPCLEPYHKTEYLNLDFGNNCCWKCSKNSLAIITKSLWR